MQQEVYSQAINARKQPSVQKAVQPINAVIISLDK
jgi:hypothetical protein